MSSFKRNILWLVIAGISVTTLFLILCLSPNDYLESDSVLIESTISQCGDSNWLNGFTDFEPIMAFDKYEKIFIKNEDSYLDKLQDLVKTKTVPIAIMNNFELNYNNFDEMIKLFEILPDGSLYIDKIANISQIVIWERLIELTNLNFYKKGHPNWGIAINKMGNSFKQYFVGDVFCWKCGCVAQKEYVENTNSLTNTIFDTKIKKREFYKTAIETKTDKVRKHKYHRLYDKQLKQYYYNNSGQFLEIGLGCNMGYGEHYGGSAFIWTKLFNNVNFIEYNGKCVSQYQDELDKLPFKIHVGDQSDIKFLENLRNNITTINNGFDIIIDDGSHFNKHIIITFSVLWPDVNKNGMYFIEDHAESSYFWNYIDSQPINIFGNEKPGTSIYFVKKLLSNLFCHITKKTCFDLKFIECRQDICAMRKL